MNIDNNIEVSICCITYNHENYIGAALESFLKQETNFNFEIVVGDDFSSDNTKKIIEKYQELYPNKIRLLDSDKNIGMNPNFIRTLKACKGSYIALCEGDDYWTDIKKIQKQRDFLIANPEAVITYADVKIEKESIFTQLNYGGSIRDLTSKELIGATPIYTLTAFFLNIIKEYPNEMHISPTGDLFLWSLLGQYGCGKFFDNFTKSVYRVHEKGVYSTKSIEFKEISAARTRMMLFSYYLSKYDYASARIVGIRLILFMLKKFGMIKLLLEALFFKINYQFKMLKKQK